MRQSSLAQLHDLGPRPISMLREVLDGLSQKQKSIGPKFLYDKIGSEIFEKICFLPEYYPTKTEDMILKTYSEEMADLIGPQALVIEPGSGNSKKIVHLLHKLDRPHAYAPIEISKEILVRTTHELSIIFSHLHIFPVCADFTQTSAFPKALSKEAKKSIVFFPGSTIGNFHPQEAISFLKRYAAFLDNDGAMIIGVDLKKDKHFFNLAYDDSQGITADFNLNLLTRLNREINADFNLSTFKHHAFYNEELGRVEMHLQSLISQIVRVNGISFKFKAGETIHTECSYKYSIEEFSSLCKKAKLFVKKYWIDPQNMFCIYYVTKEI